MRRLHFSALCPGDDGPGVASSQQQGNFTEPAIGFQAVAGLVIHQFNDQQLAHQMAQVIIGIAGGVGDLVVNGEKITVKTRQPAVRQGQQHHRIGGGGGQAPALMTVHYRQVVSIQLLTEIAVMQPDAAFQHPQQR